MTGPDPTRRWVLQVGSGVLLTGFSGMPGPAAETLPPGLYLPSSGHVAHALKAAASARPLANYSAQFFSPAEMIVVRRIVGALLGDVPEAPQVIPQIVDWIDLTVYESAAVRAAANGLAAPHRALAVAYYGAESVQRLETFDPQSVCRNGLRVLAEDTGAATAEGLSTLLSRYLGAQKSASEDALAQLFSFLKARAFEGYYTSRQGLRELDYKGNAFYVDSPGCTHPPQSHA